MKRIKLFNMILGLALIYGVFLISCKKDEDSADQEVSFAITNPGSMLKSTSSKNLDMAEKILLTIVNHDGTPTKYTSAEIELFQMNGTYFSQKILLKTGTYKLTEFLLLDADNNIIFVAPMAGSQEAQNVGQPLPIIFNILKGTSTPINLEVISTESKTIEAFGYTRFHIKESKGVEFQIAVVDRITGDFVSSKLTIYNRDDYGAYSTYLLKDSSTNFFTIDTTGTYNKLHLIFFKEGYQPHSVYSTWDSLAVYQDTPLLVELESSNLVNDKVSDVEGNVYKTVKIGEQWWMAENLVTATYADGTPIPVVTEDDIYTWADTTEGIGYYEKGFYTWKAAMKGKESSSLTPSKVQGVCPDGWHLPSYTEWNQLVAYLCNNGYGYGHSGGDVAKALASTSFWEYPYDNLPGNVGFIKELNNSTGFSGQPLSYFYNESHNDIGLQAVWWTSTTSSDKTSHKAVARALLYNSDKVNNITMYKSWGLNVRCVKN